MITKELIEYGLGDKEAKAYLTLLELEIASVQEIAKASGINRSSTYVTLESLKKRGLVSISDDKNVRRYIATPPEALLRSAEDQALKQENIRRKIEAIIPDMKALYKGTRKKPVVRVFEGKEGLISAFEETLNNNKEKLIRVASSVGILGKELPGYLPIYIKKRFSLGIKMRGIHPKDEAFNNLLNVIPKNFDTPIGIPEHKYNLPADLAIFNDKIAYMSTKNDGIAISIESKEMSDVMKSIFDLAFEEAKRLNRQISEKKNK